MSWADSPSWTLQPLFDRENVFATNTMIFCCHDDIAKTLHAAALDLAPKHNCLVVDVAIGEDPREALYRVIGRGANVGIAVDQHFKTAKHGLLVIVRDAARFAGNEDGLTITRALKSARDRVDPRLKLLMFGSDFKAMCNLVVDGGASFFGDRLLRC